MTAPSEIKYGISRRQIAVGMTADEIPEDPKTLLRQIVEFSR